MPFGLVQYHLLTPCRPQCMVVGPDYKEWNSIIRFIYIYIYIKWSSKDQCFHLMFKQKMTNIHSISTFQMTKLLKQMKLGYFHIQTTFSGVELRQCDKQPRRESYLLDIKAMYVYKLIWQNYLVQNHLC